METFSGKLKFHDGTIVDSVLTITDETLTVTADTIEVGTWPMKYCRASRASETEFELNVDGETTWFYPVDPYGFGKAAADRFVGSSIADRINVIRNMPLERMIEVSEPQADQAEELQPPPRAERVRPEVSARRSMLQGPVLITLLLVVVATLVAVVFSMLGRTRETESAPASTTITVVQNDAAAVFMSTPAGFQERWNAQVRDSEDGRLLIAGKLDSGSFNERLADHVRISGDVGGDGTVETIELSIEPTTSAEDTELALAAMGTAIAVTDPLLTGRERLELLQSLGLAYPEDLSLEGIDDALTRDGIRFRLRFFDLEGVDSDLLLFSIAETS